MDFPKVDVLFVTTVDLLNESGGTRYSKSVLNSLGSRYAIDILTLSHRQKIKNRKARLILSLIKSLVTGTPPNVLFHSGMVDRTGLEMLGRKWDLIIIDHLESFFVLNAASSGKLLYVSHNRESALVRQKLPWAPGLLVEFLAAWVERCEVKLASQVGGIVCISNLEAIWYRKFSRNVGVVYPVFDILDYEVADRIESEFLRVGFLGSGYWKPNADAVKVLVEEVFPLTKRKIRFVLAGTGWEKETISASMARVSVGDNIETDVIGYVRNAQVFWSAIDVFAAPIGVGAGVNVKVCEALANGIPVVTLPYALRGLSASIVSCGGILPASSVTTFAGLLDSFRGEDHVFSPPVEFTNPYSALILKNIVESA